MTNANGYASCGGSGTLASIVSLLGAGVYVRPGTPDPDVYGLSYDIQLPLKEPVIVTG